MRRTTCAQYILCYDTTMDILFDGVLWRYQGGAAWFFISVPKEYTSELRSIAEAHTKGFGSIKVDVAIGKSRWRTSVFPDTKSGMYMLPVKKEVRMLNNLEDGSSVAVKLTVIEV